MQYKTLKWIIVNYDQHSLSLLLFLKYLFKKVQIEIFAKMCYIYYCTCKHLKINKTCSFTTLESRKTKWVCDQSSFLSNSLIFVKHHANKNVYKKHGNEKTCHYANKCFTVHKLQSLNFLQGSFACLWLHTLVEKSHSSNVMYITSSTLVWVPI